MHHVGGDRQMEGYMDQQLNGGTDKQTDKLMEQSFLVSSLSLQI